MAAPLPRPRLARPSQESAGNGLDLPPPPSFPPPNRPNAPPNELEQAEDDYVNSDSFGEGLQGTDNSKPSAPDLPGGSPRTGLKPKNKAPPPPPGARGFKSSYSPVLTTKSYAPPQPQSLPQLSDTAPPKVTSPTPAKSLTSVTTPTASALPSRPPPTVTTPTTSAVPSRPPPTVATHPASALPTRPPPPATTKTQSTNKAPVTPAPRPQVPSPSAGDTSTGTVSDDSKPGGGGGGGGGRGNEGAAVLKPYEDPVTKDVSLKPKRQAPPRPPVKGGSGTGDQTDSADSSDGSQHKEGVINGGVAKEDGGKGEEPKLMPGIGESGEDVVKATPAPAKAKPFPKVGRVALPGMIASGEKKLEQEKQTTSSTDGSRQLADMTRTPDGSRQLADMTRTPDGSRQLADMTRTPDGSRQLADMTRTPDGSRQLADMTRTPDGSRQLADMTRTPDGSRQLADMTRTPDGSRQLADMTRTPDGSRQLANMTRTPDGSRQLADNGKLADSSVMLWDMANMGIFSIELHKGLHDSIGLVIVTGKLSCTTGVAIDGVFVQRILPNSPASKDGRIQRGDMLLEVANRATVGVSLEEATRMLREAAEDVKLKIGRPPDGAASLSAEDLHGNSLSAEGEEAMEQLKMKLKVELQTSLEAQAAQFSIERKAVESELEKLKRELEISKNEFARMEHNKMSELTQALATITMEKLKSDRELEAVRSTLAQNPPAELSSLRGEVATLQSQLSSLRSELLAEQEEKRSISQQLQDSQHELQESCRESDRELEAVRSTLAQNPPAELSSLRGEVATLRGEVATLQSQLSSLRSELSAVHSAKKSIEEQLNMTQKQLISSQQEYDSLKNTMLLERERALSLQLAVQVDQKQCTPERDEEKKKSTLLEKLPAQSSQRNGLGDSPVLMTPELANRTQGSSEVIGTQKRIAVVSDPPTVPEEEALDSGDLAVLKEHTANKTASNEVITDTFNLFLAERQPLIKQQDDTSSHDDLSSVTPSHDDLSSVTPSHDDLSSVTPSHDDLSSVTPSHDGPSSVTPSHDDLSSVTPSHDDLSSVTPSHDDLSSVTPSRDDLSSVTPSHDGPSSVTPSHDGPSSVVDIVPSSQSMAVLEPNGTTQVASSVLSLASDVGEGQDQNSRNHDNATTTNASIVQDHTHTVDALDFSDIPEMSRLDSSQSLHKKELGTKLHRKRPSRSHLQRMGQESGISVTTGDLTLERAESPEAPVPSEKPRKAAVPLPRKANSIDCPEPLSSTDVSEEQLCKPPSEANKVPVPVPRPKPTPRVKDKSSKSSEEQDITASHDGTTASHDGTTASHDGTAASHDGTLGSRPASSSNEDATPLAIKNSPRPSPMSSPKPSPKHVLAKSSDNGMKGKVEEMKVQADDLTLENAEMKGVPKPLPKPRSTARIAGEVDHTTLVDSKTQLDDLAAKDPSELTIKEKTLLAQRMLAPKDKPKGPPPVAKKPEPATSPELLADPPQLDVQNPAVASSEPVAKPKKLPPGAFSMMVPALRRPPSDFTSPESIPGNTSLQMPGTSVTMDNTSADSEMVENKAHKKLPAGAFSMIIPGGSPASVPLPQKPSTESSECIETSNKQHVEGSVEAFPQRSWSSGAKKLPPGAFNMAAGSISRSGEGINRELSSDQSPQLSARGTPALVPADTAAASSELPGVVGTPTSVKRPLDSAVVMPAVKQSLPPPPTAVDSTLVDNTFPPPSSQLLPPPSSQLLPPPPSQPLPSSTQSQNESPSLERPVAAKGEVEEDNLSWNEEMNAARTDDLMADNASTDGLDLPSSDGVDYDQVLTWNATQVGKWLAGAGLGQYTQGFTDKNIVGSALLELDGAKLKSAVSDAEDRNTFKKKVKALKAHVEKQKKAVEKQKKEEKKRQDAEKKQQKKKGK